ncbi:hypothetical protein ACOSQ3_015223 [Xanthoceras sorbifolium]
MILRYEWLPEFCSNCDMLGHTTRECVGVNHSKLVDSNLFDYGGWLRASSPVRTRGPNLSHATQTGSDRRESVSRDSESPTERNPASTVVSPEKVVLSPVESPYSDNIKLISKSKQTVVGTLDIQCESNFSGNSGGVNVGNDKVETIVVEGFSEQHVAEVAVKDASVNMMVVDGLNEPAEVTDAPMEWGSA